MSFVVYRIEVYEGRDGDWYWRMVANNGKTIADGAEGYENRSNALRAAKRMVAIMRGVGAGTIGIDIDVLT